MFLKVSKSGKYTYVKIVESFWENGVSKHRVLANLGRFEELEGNSQLSNLGRRFMALAGEEAITTSDLDICEEDRLCYGDIVYRKLWEKFDFDALFAKILGKRRLRFDFGSALFLMLIDRLLNPQSKLASYQNQGRYLNIKDVQLHHLYRVLDVLADSKAMIESHLFEKQVNLFSLQVDVVFFDLTTFHFESVRPDELKNFGYSKAGKVNEVQVFFALLVDREGRPIGFEVYPGNTFEGNTLIDALDKLKQRYSIRKLVFVADSALNSGANLNLIRKAGYEYIVSASLKKQRKAIIKQALDPSQYHHTYDRDAALTFKCKWIDHQVSFQDESGKKESFADHLLVTWSAKRAEKDRKDRERQVEKARKMLRDNTSPDKKKGAAKYLKIQGESQVVGLDEEKIASDARWDGYFGIQCLNRRDYKEILEQRNILWKVEDSFRVMKSTLETRPVFHWTPKRIEGHFTLCFIAFTLERTLEIKLKNNQLNLSPEKIKEALNSLEVSSLAINGDAYYLKAKPKSNAGKILRAFKIKPIQNLTPKEDFRIE